MSPSNFFTLGSLFHQLELTKGPPDATIPKLKHVTIVPSIAISGVVTIIRGIGGVVVA